MARIRKIERIPATGRNYYIVDACFLANRYIPIGKVPPKEAPRLDSCLAWWREIDGQLATSRARVYCPDICIAEAFKTLAKKYYVEHWFSTPVELNNARNRMRRDVSLAPRVLRAARRRIRFHDIPVARDIILAVDRFYELFLKHGKNVSLPDLVVLASAKYLIDFFDLPKSSIHVVTLDHKLWEGSKKIPELPNAYDPTQPQDAAASVFR
jgi:hypothetical protein